MDENGEKPLVMVIDIVVIKLWFTLWYKIHFSKRLCRSSLMQLIFNVMDICLLTDKCLYGYWYLYAPVKYLTYWFDTVCRNIPLILSYIRQINKRNMLPKLQFTMLSALLDSVRWNIVHVQWPTYDKLLYTIFRK